VSCGLGTQNRHRMCDSPPTSKGGMFCEGESSDERHCEINCISKWENVLKRLAKKHSFYIIDFNVDLLLFRHCQVLIWPWFTRLDIFVMVFCNINY